MERADDSVERRLARGGGRRCRCLVASAKRCDLVEERVALGAKLRDLIGERAPLGDRALEQSSRALLDIGALVELVRRRPRRGGVDGRVRLRYEREKTSFPLEVRLQRSKLRLERADPVGQPARCVTGGAALRAT